MPIEGVLLRKGRRSVESSEAELPARPRPRRRTDAGICTAVKMIAAKAGGAKIARRCRRPSAPICTMAAGRTNVRCGKARRRTSDKRSADDDGRAGGGAHEPRPGPSLSSERQRLRHLRDPELTAWRPSTSTRPATAARPRRALGGGLRWRQGASSSESQGARHARGAAAASGRAEFREFRGSSSAPRQRRRARALDLAAGGAIHRPPPRRRARARSSTARARTRAGEGATPERARRDWAQPPQTPPCASPCPQHVRRRLRRLRPLPTGRRDHRAVIARRASCWDRCLIDCRTSGRALVAGSPERRASASRARTHTHTHTSPHRTCARAASARASERVDTWYSLPGAQNECSRARAWCLLALERAPNASPRRPQSRRTSITCTRGGGGGRDRLRHGPRRRPGGPPAAAAEQACQRQRRFGANERSSLWPRRTRGRRRHAEALPMIGRVLVRSPHVYRPRDAADRCAHAGSSAGGASARTARGRSC